jgi:hypothetical protein
MERANTMHITSVGALLCHYVGNKPMLNETKLMSVPPLPQGQEQLKEGQVIHAKLRETPP